MLPRVEKLLAIMRQSELRSFGSNDVRHAASFKDDVSCGIDKGNGHGRLEIGDSFCGRLLLVGVLIVVGLVCRVDDFGKEFGGDAGATIERADLRVVVNGAEGVFRAEVWIRTGFSSD